MELKACVQALKSNSLRNLVFDRLNFRMEDLCNELKLALRLEALKNGNFQMIIDVYVVKNVL